MSPPGARTAPPTQRSAAAQSLTATKPSDTAIIRPGAARAGEEHAGAQMRRRRDAALRLPALDDGARDPLDRIALRHNTIRPLHVYVTQGARYALLRGPARPLLEELAVRGVWSNADAGRHVRAEHVPDILALAASQPDEWAVRLHRIEVAE